MISAFVYVIDTSTRDVMCLPCIAQLQIEDSLILDATKNENACSSSQTTVAITRGGQCSGLAKSRGGFLTQTDVVCSLEMAAMASISLFRKLDAVVKLTADEDAKHPDIVPSRVGLLA